MDLQFRPLTLAMPQSLHSINKAIRPSVAEFIGSLADNLTKVIKDRLCGFTKRFSEGIAKITRQSSKLLLLLITPAAKFQLWIEREGNQQLGITPCISAWQL